MADTRNMENNVIFGFLVPEKMGKDTKIKVLSLLLTDVGDIKNTHGGHFEKWPPQSPQVKSGWAPVLK